MLNTSGSPVLAVLRPRNDAVAMSASFASETALSVIVVATVPTVDVTSPVNAGIRAAGSVPDDKLEAFRFVRFAPLSAGKVAGKRASGRVPLERSPALRVVRF